MQAAIVIGTTRVTCADCRVWRTGHTPSNISINSYNTRNKSKLRQPRSKYEYMYRNFSYRGVYICNKLQDHIKFTRVQL